MDIAPRLERLPESTLGGLKAPEMASGLLTATELLGKRSSGSHAADGTSYEASSDRHHKTSPSGRSKTLQQLPLILHTYARL